MWVATMQNARIPFDALDPDGVAIIIPWDALVPGDSIFFPCINTVEAKAQVKSHFRLRGWEVVMRAQIEHDIWGLRIWRTA